jgi:hypothetical protein
MAVTQGGDIKKKLETSWWEALGRNPKTGPAVQLVNSRFVPLPCGSAW